MYLSSTSQTSEIFTTFPIASTSPLLIPYSCGMFNALNDTSSYQLYRLDSLFSGPNRGDLIFHPDDGSSPVFLQATNPRYLGRPASHFDMFDLGDCRATALVKFLRNGTQTDAQLMCIAMKGYSIRFYDVIVEMSQEVLLPGFSKGVEGGEPKDYIVD